LPWCSPLGLCTSRDPVPPLTRRLAPLAADLSPAGRGDVEACVLRPLSPAGSGTG
jgi:hypothetical protein